MVQITHVPYKGGGQSLIDLIGGQLQMVRTRALSKLRASKLNDGGAMNHGAPDKRIMALRAG